MADHPAASTYATDAAAPPVSRARRPVAAPVRVTTQEVVRPAERRRAFLATLDTPVVVVMTLLLAIGGMMVYSTTFDWSYQAYGSEAIIFLQHVRNIVIGLGVLMLLTALDYRIWKRFAVLVLLVTFALLVGVLLFGDNTFGARRAFFQGSYQPGELAELTIIIYLAAWLGSRNERIRSLTHSLLPFAVVVGVMCYLVILQPDISTAAMIALVAGVMFFMAGGNLVQIGIGTALAAVLTINLLSSARLDYAQQRVTSYISGAADLTQANYHVQQAVIAFINGGWTGVGLGEGRQKFGFLPAPHTDSIFAVIGEELGFIGATLVVLLYVVLVFRGFQIARRAPDLFGALLAAGVTIWIAAKALLNIAVMTAVLPATGAPLPFISFGGSSLVVIMAGTGLLLSVGRVAARSRAASDWRTQSATVDRSRGNRGQRVSRAGRSRSDTRPAS